MRSPRTTRLTRLAPLAIAASLLVAACGDAQEEDGASATTAGDATATTAADGTATSDATGTTDAAEAPVNPDVPPKPEVEIPTGEVTELTITDLTEGTGDAAAEGDIVVVHYVGVRSADGTEFDNSYDRGSPFPVTLGAGQVIAGWDQGLIGVKEGGQRQLDIPADLAYGDSPQGDVIQPGDALTFVVDVMKVVSRGDAEAPEVTVEPGTTVDSLEVEELTAGEGDEVQPGQSIAFDYVFIRADTGEQLESSWDEGGGQQQIPYDEAQLPPALFEGFAGAQVGSVRKITIPFADASQIFQLPGDTDIVLVVRVNGFF